MLQDIFGWLLATFVIGPIQAEISTRMQVTQAPAAIVRQMQGCVTTATPVLVRRATDDPWWGVTTTISVAVGMTDAKTVLAETSPACAAAVTALRSFLTDTKV